MKRKTTSPKGLLIAVDSLRREKETGVRNPMEAQGVRNGAMAKERFETGQEAFNSLRVGDAATAKRLQAENIK